MNVGLFAHGWRRKVGMCLLFLLVAIILFRVVSAFLDEPEIALVYAEPWEEMRKRSSASIPPAIANHYGFHVPSSDARLRLVDAQYGFVTPLARFFTISFDNQRVANVRMSPQQEPLLLDDALNVVLDLQKQWRGKGWLVSRPFSDPPIEDTPSWRIQLRDIHQGGRTIWQASDKYQIMLDMGRFKDNRHPEQERYVITLELARPWIPGEG